MDSVSISIMPKSGVHPRTVKTMPILFVWTGIAILIAIITAVVGFTDVAPGASEMARIVFYLILTLALLIPLIGFIVFRKVTSVARGFGLNTKPHLFRAGR